MVFRDSVYITLTNPISSLSHAIYRFGLHNLNQPTPLPSSYTPISVKVSKQSFCRVSTGYTLANIKQSFVSRNLTSFYSICKGRLQLFLFSCLFDNYCKSEFQVGFVCKQLQDRHLLYLDNVTWDTLSVWLHLERVAVCNSNWVIQGCVWTLEFSCRIPVVENGDFGQYQSYWL